MSVLLAFLVALASPFPAVVPARATGLQFSIGPSVLAESAPAAAVVGGVEARDIGVADVTAKQVAWTAEHEHEALPGEANAASSVAVVELATLLDAGTQEASRASAQDIESTEVHFYKKNELASAALPSAFAKYSLVARQQQGAAHGSFARLRIGPRDLTKRTRIEMNGVAATCSADVDCGNPGILTCNGGECVEVGACSVDGDCDIGRVCSQRTCVSPATRPDARVLRAGDELVLFAINHATGYAGMKTVVVPEYQEGASDIPEIVGDIRLFPPEVEVTVQRQLNPHGVPSQTLSSRIREGGAATQQDQFLKVSTRWRVRLAPHIEDDVIDGGARLPGYTLGPDAGFTSDLIEAHVDAGLLIAEGADAGFADGGVVNGASVDGGPVRGVSALLDEGIAGLPLERACADLDEDEDATASERLDCLNDETTLTDVPVGIPPLSGRIVRLAGVSSTDALFQIRGGPWAQQLMVARDLSDQDSALPIQNGLHLIHVVGRPLRHADTDGDGTLSDTEASIGSAAITSDAPLQAAAPDFQDEQGHHGFPAKAIAIKAVYDARLRPEDGGPARKVPSFDTTREHRFRVLSVESPKVEAGTGTSTSRELGQGDNQAHAGKGDTWYSLVAELLDPGATEQADRGLDAPGEFELRLGGDDVGMDCSIVVTDQGTASRGIEGMCDGASLDEVISALDIVYIELFESGNSDNVLYRYNLYGTRQRVDHAAVNSDWTAEKSIIAPVILAKPEVRPAKAAPSEPSLSVFFLDPAQIQTGTVQVCQKFDCSGVNDPLKDLDVFSYSPENGFAIGDRPTSKVKLPLIPMEQETGTTQWFKLVLSADMAKMRGLDNEGIRYHVVYAASAPVNQIWRVPFKVPEGRTESAGTMSAGHMVVANVDVADGRLVRSYPDVVLPEKSTTRSFVRFYNNQTNEIGPLGPGWSHNLEATLIEELPGRYLVLFDGEARVFEKCDVDVSGETPSTRVITSMTSCVTDKTHGGLLRVTASSIDGGLTYPVFSAELETEDGVVVTFDEPMTRYDELGRRRYSASSIDDGLKEKLWFTYTDGLVSTVTRATAPGGTQTGLSFAMHYEAIPDTPSTAAEVTRAKDHGLQRLARVEAKLPSSVVVAEVKFDHDSTRTNPACGAAPTDVPRHYNNLTRACRFTRGAAARVEDLRWQYSYDAPQGRNLDAVLSANELKQEQLDLVPMTLTSKVYSATYGRDASGTLRHPYRQIAPVEVISTATVQGEKYDFAYVGTTREVVFPVGGKKTSTVNRYGNVASFVTPCGTTTSSWESDRDDGRAVSQRAKDASGFANAPLYDSRNRVNQVELVERPATDMSAVVGLATGRKTTVLERDEKTGIPTRVAIPQQDGSGTVEATTTVDARGFVTGGGLGGILSWNQPLDDDGRPSGAGTTLSGHVVTVSTFDGEWGLPASMEKACPACPVSVTDDFGNTVFVHQTRNDTTAYDTLGRQKTHTDLLTGTVQTWEYDALGRVTFTSVDGDGDPETVHFGDESRTFTYRQDGEQLTVDEGVFRRETLSHDGSVSDHSYTRKQVYRRGLLIEETDEAGVVSATKYDANDCRATEVTSTGGTAQTRVEFIASTVPNAVKQRKLSEIQGDGEGGITTTVLAIEDFDEQGRIVRRATEADEGEERMTYSADGLLLKQEYGAGHSIDLVYDNVGRLVERVSSTVGANDADGIARRALRETYGSFLHGTLPGTVTSKQRGSEERRYDVNGALVYQKHLIKGLALRPGDELLNGNVQATQLIRSELTGFSYGPHTTTTTHYGGTSPLGTSMTRKITRVMTSEGRPLRETDGTDSAELKYSYERDDRGLIAKTTTEIVGGAPMTIVETQGPATSQITQGTTVMEVKDFYAGGAIRSRLFPPLNNARETYQLYDGGRPRVTTRVHPLRPELATTTVHTFDDVGRVLDESTFDAVDLNLAHYTHSTFVDEVSSTSFTQRVERNGVLVDIVSGTMDGNGRLVRRELPTFWSVQLHDANGVPVTPHSPAGPAPRVYLSDPAKPFSYDNVDGGRTFIGYHNGTAHAREVLVVAGAEWTEVPTSCASSGGPADFDPNAIAEMIAAGRVGNAQQTFTLTMSPANLVNGKPRCELLAITKAAFRESAEFHEQLRKNIAETEMAIAGMLIPGPEDLILAYGLRRVGEMLARRATLRALGKADDVIERMGQVCRVGGTPCFVAGTTVQTADGDRAIETIEPGEMVWTKDPWTGVESFEPVTRTFVTPGSAIIDIELVDHAGASVDVLGTTGEHPFFVRGRGFVEAVNLVQGDNVQTADGGWLSVGTTIWRPSTDDVFNLEVGTSHTYFVGESGAWVHNNSGCAPSWKKGKSYGHTFIDHGHGVSTTSLADQARAVATKDGAGAAYKGRWTDNQAAADHFFNIHGPTTASRPGAPRTSIDFEIPEGLGEVVDSAGRVFKTRRGRKVLKADGSIKTAFPVPDWLP